MGEFGNKLRKGSIIFLVVCCLISIIWYLYSSVTYYKYREYISYAYQGEESELLSLFMDAYKALIAKSNMTTSIYMFFGGFFITTLFYAFGVLIERVERIEYKLQGSLKSQSNNKESRVEMDCEIPEDIENNDLPRFWKCKCQRIIPKENKSCPACGTPRPENFTEGTRETLIFGEEI